MCGFDNVYLQYPLTVLCSLAFLNLCGAINHFFSLTFFQQKRVVFFPGLLSCLVLCVYLVPFWCLAAHSVHRDWTSEVLVSAQPRDGKEGMLYTEVLAAIRCI